MKIFSIFLISVLCIFGIAQTAQAAPKTVTLDAIKDCEVKALFPDTAFSSDPNMRSLKTATLANNSGYFAQFQLPADCVATAIIEFRWKNIVCEAAEGSNAVYVVYVRQAAEDAMDDLNTLTWNTAPAIRKILAPTAGLNYDSTTSRAVTYGAYPGTTLGGELNLGPYASYAANVTEMKDGDTDGILTFYYHERYIKDACANFASIENTTYHPPQLEITYEPTGSVTKTATLTASRDVMCKMEFPDTAFPDDMDLYQEKLDPSHTGFLWEFSFPDDCDPTTIYSATWKNTVTTPRASGSTAAYFIVIKDGYEGNVNTYTWNNAPGIKVNQVENDSLQYDLTSSAYCGYFNYAAFNTVGSVFTYNLNLTVGGAYWGKLKQYGFDADTNGKIQFYWAERYAGTSLSFASIENTSYTAPQLEIKYVPTLLQKGIVIDTYNTENAQEEGQVATTYDVYLTLEPADDVTVNLEYDTELVDSVSPTSLTFTSANYDAPQTVTVTPIDDTIALDIVYSTNIRHAATSADLDYEFAPIVNAAINIEDNDYKKIVLTSIADTDVKSIDPDAIFSSLPELAAMKADSPVDYVYSYMQFEMPSDFAYALGGSKFKITRTYVSPSTLTTLYLLGVRAENYDTGEPIIEGDVDTYTWNTAPGLELVPNVATAGNYAGYEDDEAMFIANGIPSSGGLAGEEFYMTTGTVSEPMANFINGQIGSDKKITLFIFTRYLDRNVNRFASIENGTYDGPQIELVYGATPYCGQPGTVIAEADFNEDCVVDIDDLGSMAGQWLNDSVE